MLVKVFEKISILFINTLIIPLCRFNSPKCYFPGVINNKRNLRHKKTAASPRLTAVFILLTADGL